MHNKEEYWKRRNNKINLKDKNGNTFVNIPMPLRGIPDETPKPKLVKESGIMMVDDVPMNHKQRRKRVIDRRFTKKGYRDGRKIKVKR